MPNASGCTTKRWPPPTGSPPRPMRIASLESRVHWCDLRAVFDAISRQCRRSDPGAVRLCCRQQDLRSPRVRLFRSGSSGYKNQREGLDRLRSVLAAKKVQVLLLFATNRLFRKVYLTLQFVDQTAVENGIRCVFVKSGIDTANKDQWQSLLHMRAMMDEFQVRVNADHIRAALKGMFLEGLVRGTLHLGYTGEPIAGKPTKRGRPRRESSSIAKRPRSFGRFSSGSSTIGCRSTKLHRSLTRWLTFPSRATPTGGVITRCEQFLCGDVPRALEIQRHGKKVSFFQGLHAANSARDSLKRSHV